MFRSIKRDIQQQFQSGNMLTRIILVNIAVFVFIKMVFVFTSYGQVNGIYHNIIDFLSVHSGLPKLYLYPWTWITHMFLHATVGHIFWNMLLLYWFGRIIGDFLGDDRILPLYILGGLVGALAYVLTDYAFLGSSANSMAMGASAATMTMLMAAAMISPDYQMHLILIGPVKIKWIALALLFFDIIGTAGQVNTGGHFAHLGGAFFGIYYVYQLHKGRDLTSWLQRLFDLNGNKTNSKTTQNKKAAMQVVYNKTYTDQPTPKPSNQPNFQDQLDYILDKINERGYDNLSDDEKDFLSKASKKD